MEKREFHRLSSATRITLFDANGKELCEGSVLNLSRGGVFIAYLDEEKLKGIKKGDKLKFEFGIPTGRVTGLGEVMWVDTDELQIGISFTAIDNKEGISNLVSYITSSISGWGSI